jgi:hypothetical protein
MRVSKSGTARFAKVVEAVGKPEIVSLWTKPERDKSFMAAVRQNRVMTVRQETVGSSKDFGIVGFIREKNVSYLVFPKTLKDFQGQRIVGIKYDLIETPGPIGRVVKPNASAKIKGKQIRGVRPTEWQSERERPQTKVEVRDKRRKSFTVTVRFTAVAEVQEAVEADSRKEAKELAVTRAVMPDFRRGTVTRKVVTIGRA